MNWDAISAIAEMLSAVAVVVSLVYLASQVKANTRQARGDAARDLAVLVSEISLAVASSRDVGSLLLRGGGNYDSLDALDQVRFRSLMNAFFRGMEQQFQLRREGAVDDDVWAALESVILDFTSLPGVQKYFSERGQWYTQEFLEVVWRGKPVKDRPKGPSMEEQYRPSQTQDDSKSV